MKLIIDIPEENYKFIKSLRSLIIGGRGNCKTIQKNVINAIRNGVPYEERPQGEWVIDAVAGISFFRKCSNCNEAAEWLDGGSQFLSKFCPNCGAKMRGII